MTTPATKPLTHNLAQLGLIAKGIVYILLGVLAVMAAFELGGQSNSGASRSGVFRLVGQGPAGMVLLAVLTLGLLCYCAWRFTETFARGDTKWAKRARYFLSGLAYLAACISGITYLLRQRAQGGNQNQKLAAFLLNQPLGGWLTGAAALVLAGVGLYQLWYGFSERYRKHVQGLRLANTGSKLMLGAGKVGYVARGVVWLVIAYLLLRAALHHRAAEAGSTPEAFSLIESLAMGSYLLAIVGAGLVAYGAFSIIRSRYERELA